MINLCFRYTLIAGFALLGTDASAAPLVRFQVVDATATDLGTLGGSNSSAADINNAGSIVGWAEDANGLRRACLWRYGAANNLGIHWRADPSEALGINAHDQVVGFWQVAGRNRAFRWSDPGLFETLSDGSTRTAPISSKAVAINYWGEVVGQREFDFKGTPYSEATYWTDPATFYPVFSSPPFRSTAHDINAGRSVVGREKRAESGQRWDWTGSSFRGNSPPKPGVSYNDSFVFGINDQNVIVGYWQVPPYANGIWNQHAMLWDGVAPNSVDLGVLPTGTNSLADDVNSERFVAGFGNRVELQLPGSFTIYADNAFIYHADFGLQVLPRPANVSFLAGCRAHALNDRTYWGAITVVGTCEAGGTSRAVRWDVSVKRVAAP